MPGKYSQLLLGDGLSACIINSDGAHCSQTTDGASLNPWGRGRKGSVWGGLESRRGLRPALQCGLVLRLGTRTAVKGEIQDVSSTGCANMNSVRGAKGSSC